MLYAEYVKDFAPQANRFALLAAFAPIGQLPAKKMTENNGGANSTMFNTGKSNAKMYVKSSEGIKFDDVEGVDEAKESLQEIVDCHEIGHAPAAALQTNSAAVQFVLETTPPQAVFISTYARLFNIKRSFCFPVLIGIRMEFSLDYFFGTSSFRYRLGDVPV